MLVSVKIHEAILELRARAGLSRHELAERLLAENLHVSEAAVIQWETGRRRPRREALTALGTVATKAGLGPLAIIFEGQRNSEIAARIRKLQSAGTQRRVSVADLERWIRMAEVIRDEVHEAREGYMKIMASPIHRQMRGIVDDLIPQLMESIEVYISPKRTEKRRGKTK